MEMINKKAILSETIADNIKNLIIENHLNPGDKLPNEIELTTKLNVSRSTVREAIKILVSMNILEVRRGKGTYVCDNPGIAKDPLGVTFMKNDDLLLHLFETRLLIEPQIVEVATERATEDNIQKLRNITRDLEEDIREGRNHIENDILFHNTIAKSTQNPIINRLIPIINECITGGYFKTKDLPESGETVMKFHLEILEAIEAKNPKKAKQLMEDHIYYGMKLIKKK